MLAILLLHTNEAVPSERLIDLLWNGRPPETASTALQGYVSQLRKILEPDRPAGAPPSVIVTVDAGYMIRTEPGQLDADRFEKLVARGRDALGAERPREAADAFREALALWRGPPLANVRDEAFAQDAIRRLEELQVAALEDQIDAQLALGEHSDAIPKLKTLVTKHPYRERLRGQLMVALYRTGRQAEALEVFAAARRTLVDDLGIEPSAELRELHQRVLAQDPSLKTPPRSEPVSPDAGPAAPPARRGRRLRWAGVGLVAGGVVAAIAVVALGSGSSASSSVPPNSLVLVDARDGAVRTAIDVGGTPTSVSVGGGAAWVLNADDDTISRIDARTHAVKTFGSGGTPTDLAAGAGALWVGNGKRTRAQFVGPVATSVVRLDPSSTAIRGAVSLPAARGFTSNLEQDHIAVTPHAVWVVNPDATVSRIDPRTDEVTGTVKQVRADALAAGDEGVWALGLDSSLDRIDPRRPGVEQRIRVAASSLTALAVGAGAVWAADPYDGTVWRVDLKPHVIQRTIDVGAGVSDVAYGMGSVWALNGLRGTLTRIDPRTNQIAATIDLGNTPRQLALGAGGVWVTVAGAVGEPVPAAAPTPQGGPALPASTCGRVFYGGEGAPDRLIVSDMPLRGGSGLPTQQMSQAIAYVLRQRDFRAGPFTVGYQACDDSTAQTGIFDPDKCVANAKLYAATPAVIGEVGPYNSGCAEGQIPIANEASGGPLAMVSPTNSDIGLTHATPITPQGLPGRLYPTGSRNYVRLYPPEDAQAAADAVFARDLGAGRVAILSDGGFGEAQAFHFAQAARRLGLDVVVARRWGPDPASYRSLAAGLARSRPDAVFLSGLLDTNGGQLIRALRAQLPASTKLLANDGFLPIATLFAIAGGGARGVYVSRAGPPIERLPRPGRRFVGEFSATQAGRPVDQVSVYAAQATDVLLDAIGRSDGTRASVVAALRRTRVRHGLLGSFGFDRRGDSTVAPITIVRARHAGGSRTVLSTDGATVERIIDARPRLVRRAHR